MKLIHLTIYLLLAFVLSCSNGGEGIAGASETTNGIEVMAAAYSITLTARPGVSASLYSSNYDPALQIGYKNTMVTGDSITCTFNSLLPGDYNLLVTDLNSQNAAFITSIPIYKDSAKTSTSIMTTTGSINGIVQGSRGYVAVFIYGSPFYSNVNQAGEFTLPNIPQGTFEVHAAVIFTPMSGQQPYHSQDTISVTGGQASVLVFN